ncbi:MAG: S41 family peptidase [bacterium]
MKTYKTFTAFAKSRVALGIYIALVLVIVFGLGTLAGYKNRPEVSKFTGIMNSTDEVSDTADFNTFWKAWRILNEKQVSAKDIGAQEKVWGAIEGLASSFKDPYTVFMPPVQAKDFDSQVSGNFGGVGMEIGLKDNIVTVIAPLKGSPSEKAGMRSGDKVIEINKKITSGMSSEDAVHLIRGEVGTVVKLLVFRQGRKLPFEVEITRAVIQIPTIDTEKRADGIFVIRLYSFSAPSANLFRDALQKFIDSGSTKLILDLRGNPGGYLDAATDMASWFLPKGAVVVRENYGAKQPEDTLRSFGYNVFADKSIKMVILVNGGSASASEILSGALSEHGVAKLVGTQTFGKGSVQELIKLTSDTNLKVTIAKWYTPNGVSISEKGITPDYIVDLTEADVNNHKDPQMDKAVQVVLGKAGVPLAKKTATSTAATK